METVSNCRANRDKYMFYLCEDYCEYFSFLKVNEILEGSN